MYLRVQSLARGTSGDARPSGLMFAATSVLIAWSANGIASSALSASRRIGICHRMQEREGLPLLSQLRDFINTQQGNLVGQLELPTDDAAPEEVVQFCMDALKTNDDPSPDAGKWINWELGGDMIRSIHGGDPANFLKWSRRSPVYDCLVNCDDFYVDLDTLTHIPGTPTRGALCKVVVHVTPSEAVVDGPRSVRGRIGKPPSRSFLWTMQQQRRPPRIGAWLIYQVLAIDHAFELTE